ncbi:hypothetical protein AA0242T_0663 [Acetobacter aceti NRIC 0242]|uniref:DUF883 domain-containing protein n=2 Tax=Acetobacter aceti TaxID=435 RepID=A0A6S6PHG3_ACEAC|nr:hypothetical protein [Acetobacter aceti]GBO79961.1 hypothetical protein AA0242T_0663 [Acetobacter aceti NRIC 0242]TCS33918.1 hypothetical protein EDC15_105131 [Acetobacter aceti NBRC 14818]BCI68497.1 hypothetical protein AAJCM20276_31210 [Acetobacter aceti]BCK76076.1 hypothetical protein EMQ_1682 [Acetobacter aceti NBRC 14818]GAN57640.1 hypothetical protein Abac_018_053 [Acetobacter aceti NBRC 14818]
MANGHSDENDYTLESGIESLQSGISGGTQATGSRLSDVFEDGCDVLRDVTVDTPRLSVGIALLLGSVFGMWLARR